ncbi:MAG TPA: pantetheine-phosphate adenylyltransferase [Chloroflexota bacterium]|nr:pantetheine-phosphate adenylyltransferase [Chloroflexota bacterium]
MKVAIMAASFDPITNGHVDLAVRASAVFDSLVVAVYESPKKDVLFSVEERVRLVREALASLPNVRVSSYTGLLVDYAKTVGASVMVRGLRATSDFDYEFQLASMNRKLSPQLEIMFFLADTRYTFLSSSIVKEIAELGGDVSDLVPESVGRSLKSRYGSGER